jgi:hypothetical protein
MSKDKHDFHMIELKLNTNDLYLYVYLHASYSVDIDELIKCFYFYDLHISHRPYFSEDEYYERVKDNISRNYEYFYERWIWTKINSFNEIELRYLKIAMKKCHNLFKNRDIEKELIKWIWHPKRVVKWLESGKDMDEYEELYSKN